MDIDIHQGRELPLAYDVYVQDRRVRHIRTSIGFFSEYYELWEVDPDKRVLNITWPLSIIGTKSDIEFANGSVAQFRTVSIWKGHYRCRRERDQFDIYAHRGRKYSVFNDGKQIACWEENAAILLNAHEFRIKANDNCDIDLLVALSVILDDSDVEDLLKFNLGHIGPEEKTFDTNWQPNSAGTSV